jgi:hypothetical protein
MTPRSLFTIILRVLGLFFLRDFLAMVPQLLSVLLLLNNPDHISDPSWYLISSILTLLIYGAVVYFLIFRSGFLIDKLKLDKGFDQETIPLNIHRSTILGISIIVIGGLMAVNEIPNFCRQLYSYYQEKKFGYGQGSPRTVYFFIFSAAKIIIGILLMGYQQRVITWIEWKRKRKWVSLKFNA